MRTPVDLSTYLVLYNLVVGVLLLLASDKIASVAMHIGPRVGPAIQRYARTPTSSLGATVAVLSAGIYVVFHVLRLGLD